MTTIAYDGKTIAADGQRTYGDQVVCNVERKLIIKAGRIYAFTGIVPLMAPMIGWHMAGADPRELPLGWDKGDGGWSLIVLGRDGLHKYSSTSPYPEPFTAPIAFGAGQDYAIGAMCAGADARMAVDIVSRLCIHTGGEIQAIEVSTVVGRPMHAEAAE